jgi:hypothetical protein
MEKIFRNFPLQKIYAPFKIRIIDETHVITRGMITYKMNSNGNYKIISSTTSELTESTLVNEITPMTEKEFEEQGYVTFKYIQEDSDLKGKEAILIEDEFFNDNKIGTKQTEGKLNYELDFGFITQMAERMAQNKGKYEPYNWKKPIDVELLKQALFRHVIDVMNGKYDDDGREFGHLESIALDAKMINYQLKYNKQ